MWSFKEIISSLWSQYKFKKDIDRRNKYIMCSDKCVEIKIK